MGELKRGDVVYDERGEECRVIQAHPIELQPELWELTFDDHTTIVSCVDHQWVTFDLKELGQLTRSDPAWRANRRKRRLSRSKLTEDTPQYLVDRSKCITQKNKLKKHSYLSPPKGTVRTTREIINTLRVGIGKRCNHAISTAKALGCPEAELSIDPYVLGAWLGDGAKLGGKITNVDSEVWREIEKRGYVINNLGHPNDKRVVGLTTLLRKAGLRLNKHVPQIYLRASYQQRLDLLRGLMDTDGTARNNDGGLSFTNTNKKIIDGFCELVTSLGWKYFVREHRATLYEKDCGPCWIVKFTATEYVFNLTRKKERQRFAIRRVTKFRYIVDAKPVESKPGRCITVDSPSSMYLAGKQMVPTHNTAGLLIAALMYVDCPGYNAILLRDTFKNLTKPKQFISLSHEWLGPTDAVWKDGNHWVFPSGSTLEFGYLDGPNDHFNYQGAEYQFVGIDEVVNIREHQAIYLFSRLRRRKGSMIPIRFRCASNPPTREQMVKGAWVKERYVDVRTKKKGTVFVPARLDDNPHLDADDYRENSLSELDSVTRRQLEEGDWEIQAGGEMFQRAWFPIVQMAPKKIKWIRYWDMAGTEASPIKSPSGQPAFTCGVKMGLTPDKILFVDDVIKGQWSPKQCERMVKQTADMDGVEVEICMEQEPGSSGKHTIHYYRKLLIGYTFRGDKVRLSKTQRWGPLASQAEGENVALVAGQWNREFLEELDLAPGGPFLDQVDAASGACQKLIGAGRGVVGARRV